MHTHVSAKLNLPRVISLVSFPTSVNDSERPLRLNSQTDTIWRVSSCISFVNYFSRESISRHLSSVRPSILSTTVSYPGERGPKIFMCADTGLSRARSNRSHRTRERRGPINIEPPDQIAFRLKKGGEKRKREHNTKILSFFSNACRGHFARSRIRCETYRFALNSHEFREVASSWEINRAWVCAARQRWLFSECRNSRGFGEYQSGGTGSAEGGAKWKRSVPGRTNWISGAYAHVEARQIVKWMLLRRALAIVTGKSRGHGRIARFKFIDVRADGPTMVARFPQQVLLLLILGE